ncbi:MAG: pyruvate, phosphate dikinase [Fibrobacteria bacterium]|nr:pyruvate, phosphate dikinase [Fibrobacteria bacterium]
MAPKQKYVYSFGGGKAEGRASMKNLLGGKGANLAEMSSLGIIVPSGFTITTEVCTYFQKGHTYPIGMKDQVNIALAKVEKDMGRKFNDPKDPLLLSVRSGARISMPGMMDTVLNLGLNDTTIKGLIDVSGDARFAYDSYRRFVMMYSNVVMGVDSELFEDALEKEKEANGVELDTDLSADSLKKLVKIFKAITKRVTKKAFPEKPEEQLYGGIGAVFGSWMVDRAISYRRINRIPEDWGTAVNVQAMVFGNAGEDCATGVAFTRDPATGENKFFGEFLINAQGEDVVAGIRTPQVIREGARQKGDAPSLEKVMPKLYKELDSIRLKLEKHYKDMQDIEFTIEHDKLWMLQTRTGKRTAEAALRCAVEMVKEKLISKTTAVARVEAGVLDQLLHPSFDPKAKKVVLAKGLPASPGAATGMVVFTAEAAVEWSEKGKATILCRKETSPEDIEGMNSANGILTGRGGMTSHAAVVARGMGKCCVAGCGALDISAKSKTMKVAGKTLKEGDWISINGSSGEVMLGEVKTIPPKMSGNFGTFMKWVDEIRDMKVRTNAETARDAKQALDFGAEGIGLCRTEHMFFEGERLTIFREMIMAKDLAGRKAALKRLLPIQRKDFEGLFKVMGGLPITVRLLDPPLHEFVPHDAAGQQEMAKIMKVSVNEIKAKVESLSEFNPMLGHRGCRLGVTYPEIYDMQVQAIMEAAINVSKKAKKNIIPEIMIPLVGTVKELSMLKANAIEVINSVFKARKTKLQYMIGTMIEIPRAALTAGEIAEEAEFFSFGTNDLTQMTFGYSRDDAGVFLPEYVEKKVLPEDPFQVLDQTGVGQLVELAAKNGRAVRKGMKLGICGEHGGEPESVKFCYRTGLDYVSCSPFRVPIAKLAAAQATLEARAAKKKK